MIIKIETVNAPKAIGPYSQATRAGSFVFVSGQIPVDPVTGEIVSREAPAQAEQVFKNITAVLEAAGCSMADVVKTTVYLKDMNAFSSVNSIYGMYFNGAVLPARAAVEVARLPKDILVEAEVIAYCGQEA